MMSPSYRVSFQVSSGVNSSERGSIPEFLDRTVIQIGTIFWARKTNAMRRSGVIVYTRTVRSTNPPQEKGIDLRIGLDALALAYRRAYDALIILSTDQDFTEVNRYVREVASGQGRRMRLVSAYPVGNRQVRGINGMEQFPISRAIYDACIDPRDYRRHDRRAFSR